MTIVHPSPLRTTLAPSVASGSRMATAAERAMLQAFDVPNSTTATHPAAQREATLPLPRRTRGDRSSMR